MSSAKATPQRWRTLIVVSSFGSLSPVIQGQLRWAGPFASPLCRFVGAIAAIRGGVDLDRAQPAEWAREVRIPVLLAHGTEDPLINLSAGRTLFEAFASERKEFLEVPKGDHSRVLVTPMPLYSKMARWLLMFGSGNELRN